MRKRWYDTDPTMSMAISLLQNTSPIHQEMTAAYLLRFLEREGILKEYQLSSDRVFFIFPLVRRSQMDRRACHLLEVLKRLPRGLQIELSLNMINYIYMLETGVQKYMNDPTDPNAYPDMLAEELRASVELHTLEDSPDPLHVMEQGYQ